MMIKTALFYNYINWISNIEIQINTNHEHKLKESIGASFAQSIMTPRNKGQ